METQIDIFGNEIPVEQAYDVKHDRRETIKSRWRRMYGYDDSHKCGDCRYSFRLTVNDNKHFWKCNLMGVSSSEATDIRKSDPACKRWEERNE